MRHPRSWHPVIWRSAMLLGRAIGHLPIEHPLQIWAVWFIHNHFKSPSGRLEFRLGDCRCVGFDADLIDMEAYYFGAFEWPVVLLLRDLARALRAAGADPVLYDVGANTGHHSLFVARDVRRIYAFEPYGPVRHQFEQRLRLTRLTHIDVFPIALGDVEGDANFYPPITWNRGSGSFLGGTDHENGRRPIRLPVAVGDEFIEKHALLPPDMIKLDVQGSERLVLRGLAETIRRARPLVLGELSPAGRWLFGSEDGLRAHLYDEALILDVISRKAPRGYRLRPFDFARSEQFLCLPRERLDALATVLPRRLTA